MFCIFKHGINFHCNLERGKYIDQNIHGLCGHNKKKVNQNIFYRAWRSLAAVRRMHLTVSKKSDKAGSGIISQKDMAITQFTFMGMHLYCPDKLGIVGSQEQFEAFNHLWRVI